MKWGGIGSLGSAQASFFHPTAKIREEWLNDHKRLGLERVVVTGKELFRISRRDQVAYKCRIAEIDDGSKFHICANNFRLDQGHVQPFEDESLATACTHPYPGPPNNQEARGSNENASNNIGQWANQEDIAELLRQGVEVGNEDWLPENLPSGKNENQITGVHREWVTPTTFTRRGDPNISDAKGGWKNYSWCSIA